MYNSVVEIMVKKKLVEYLYAMNKEWYKIEDGPKILIDNVIAAVTFFEE